MSDPTRNPFQPGWSADRYAEARPRIHPRMLAAAGLSRAPVARALDLGCGTGHSSLALREHARRVVALDVSPPMLRRAPPHPDVTYVCARAEQLPVRDAACGLASLGCSFHWCEPAALFAELQRVLEPGGRVVLYDNHFYAEMRENPAAPAFFRDTYGRRYPPPPRRTPFREDAVPAGFALEHTTRVDEWVAFTHPELVRYLTTHSNVIDAVESGRETLPQIEAFLLGATAFLFRDANVDTGHFRFGGPLFVLTRDL